MTRIRWWPVVLLSMALVGCGSSGVVPGVVRDGGGGDGAVAPDAAWLDPGIDADGDGYGWGEGDCNDSDPNVHPGAVEICNDGVDNNCNGATDAYEHDYDGDSYGPCAGDCDDTDPDIHPAATEVVDGVDNNCDGIVDADLDGDGFTTADGDCNDADRDVYPGAREWCYDGKDNDCNGATDAEEADADGDGFGPCAGDCDDTDAAVHPGAQEVVDGIDNNCDNLVDEDLDGDGWTTANGDCNDADVDINPARFETCMDNIDNDCDGITDSDCVTECDIAALMRSSVGCVYYAVDTNPLHSQAPGDFAVAISNVDETETAHVVVAVKNNGVWVPVSGGSFSVAPLSLQTKVLPHRYIDGSAIYVGGAYRVTSDLPVIAYQFNPMDGSSSYFSDASLLLPTSAYDNYYIVPAWPYGPADDWDRHYAWPAHIQVVANEPTVLYVTSTGATVAGTGVSTLLPGVETAFSLDAGDYLQLTLANLNDSFAGTYIRALRPVAVFSTNDLVNVPASWDYCCGEHLEEQVFGLQTWGKRYVASRVKPRGSEPSVWQILAQEDNTTVTFDFATGVTGLPATVTLNARESIEYQVSGPTANPGDFYVTADQPILVTQFMVAAQMVSSSGTQGDPSMVQAVPVEQYLSRYVVLVPGTWQNDSFTLTKPQGATVSIDGVAVTAGWTQVGTSSYEVTRVDVSDGVHVVEGSDPFGIIVMGYDAYDSYAYPGGLNQQLINPIY